MLIMQQVSKTYQCFHFAPYLLGWKGETWGLDMIELVQGLWNAT